MNSSPADLDKPNKGWRSGCLIHVPAWAWVALGLTGLKLWLTAGQPLFAIGGADHDDVLFLNLASTLLHGHWLGHYNSLTLAKGPFYPMWVALAFVLKIPLLQSQQLVYAAACALAVRALAPVLRRDWARLGIYTLLLWNPMSFDANEMARVLREEIYPPLTLMLFACMIALYYRRTQSWRRMAPWAALLGLTWAAFYLTKEESVWIVPSLVLLGAAIVIRAWRHSRAALRQVGFAGGVAFLGAAVPLFTVCTLNARNYGWFGTVEFRAKAFKDAYGALLRVRAKHEIPYVPVTHATCERIYAVSPAFAELKPYLDGQVGFDWARVSSFLTHRPAAEREIGGGWFMWALRQAVQDSGHAHSARQALQFYASIARQVNQACDQGTLPAGPRRSGFMPPWRPGQTTALMHTLVHFSIFLTWFRHFSAYTPGSMGSAPELDQFRDLTHMQLSTPVEAKGYEYATPVQNAWNRARVDVLQRIGKVLRMILMALTYCALVLWLARAAQLAWQRRLTYPFVLATAAIGGCAACVTVLALVQVTSFPTLAVAYMGPAYPLLLVLIAAMAIDVATAWRRKPPTRPHAA